MKSDAQLCRAVLNELKRTPLVHESDVTVSVRHGVATLRGKVSCHAEKYQAERAAERVPGVRGLCCELHVRRREELERADSEITRDACDVINRDAELPRDRVKVKTEDGVVSLEGRVEWYFQRSAAERAVRYLPGVRGVLNYLVVSPTVSRADVQARIEGALTRSASLDARHICVDTEDGHVRLSGRVRCEAEREEAEHAARSAPGVVDVEDELTVA